MGKDIAHQCIDENIVPNGKKGITAQSLANTLHLMVDEDGGAGTMMIKIGTLVQGEGDILTTILTAEERAHNVEIFNAVKEATANGEAMPVITFDILSLYPDIHSLSFSWIDSCLSLSITNLAISPIAFR